MKYEINKRLLLQLYLSKYVNVLIFPVESLDETLTSYLPYWIFEKIFEKNISRNDLLRFKAFKLSDEEEAFYKSKVVVDMFQAYDICKKTITQSKSDFWFQQRKIRITASKAHLILR